MARETFARQGFQRGPDLIDFARFRNRKRRNEGAAVGIDDDQPFSLKQPDRLAHDAAAQRAALRAVYEELRDRGPAENRQALLDMKRRFYDILSQGCGNAYAARLLDRLLCRNTQLRATSLSNPDRLPRTIAEIGEIIAAIENHDPAGTAAACRRHVEQAAAIALAILAAEDSEALLFVNKK